MHMVFVYNSLTIVLQTADEIGLSAVVIQDLGDRKSVV